ncbi:beta and beta-prime subunits of DNA dependent RNA-polymerase [Clavulina sp. PMI_390]|nr:beta and beta-prime subunits of DNA dependent RNA-polymerase [Clavulina sp. PMI_390]
MNISSSVPSSVASVSFSFLSSADIKRISVKQIVNPVIFDHLNNPNPGGLYDNCLGPSTSQDLCGTCRLNYFQCPGHFGHIDLASPVFHPLFMNNMYHAMRATCLYCHHFKLSRVQKMRFSAKLQLLEHGLLHRAYAVDQIQVDSSGSGDKKMPAGGDEEEEDEEDALVEDLATRLRGYVDACLKHDAPTQRDAYKDNLVYQARKDVIAAFNKIALAKRCARCSAVGYTFRKEGHTKVIELDLSERVKEQNNARNLVRPNVLAAEALQQLRATSPSDNGMDIDAAHGRGDMDEASDADMDEEDAEAALPKSVSGKQKTKRGRNERLVTPTECRAHLRRLFANERVLCSLLYGRHGPYAKTNSAGLASASADLFFMDVVPVSPTRFRPPAKMGDITFEHTQNQLLGKIITTSYRLRDLNSTLRLASGKNAVDPSTNSAYTKEQREKVTKDLITSLVQLQIDVNSFMDSNKNPAPTYQGKLPPQGVKQLLEKKEGLFRKNMMGKRVNHAARSVISPDVNIETNEIGIPPVFAKTLTFPVPVTEENYQDLAQRVINGPVWPGASQVELENGQIQMLSHMTKDQRTALAKTLRTTEQSSFKATASSAFGLTTRTSSVNKKVYRHIQDGDMLIVNRQPTLHKPSMMAHKARILKGEKTIRMHYANCNSYNADFDGDEMNLHFPQNQIPRAEAMMIANNDNQYLVPTSGNPLRGLIQDHVVAGVWMTYKQTLFTRDDYHQIIYGALRPEDGYSGRGQVLTVPPAIWKPKALWTGKQIISTIMLNVCPDDTSGLNLVSKSKVPGALWGPNSTEQEVIFMDGELLSGVLDKAQFGASSFGFVHATYELYGADTAGKLLGVMSRLFTKFLQHRAFTCRMDDLALTPAGEAARRQLMKDGENLGTLASISNFPSLSDPTLSESDKAAALRDRLEEVLRDDNKMAGLDMTVKMKMKKLKEAVDKACIPGGLFRKFPHNHMQTMTQSGAKGSAVNAGQISSALGQQELEGRRVPVMVSGKTLPSFKAFETSAISGGYIGSRFLTGLRPQEFYFHCMAGREGLIDTAVKTSRSGYLQRCLIKHLEGLQVHYDHTVRGSDSSIYQFLYGGDGLDVTRQKYLLEGPKMQDALFYFAAENHATLVRRAKFSELEQSGHVDVKTAPAHMRKVLKSVKKGDKSKDPTISVYNPARYLGSTSERFAKGLENYILTNPHGVIKASKKDKKEQGVEGQEEDPDVAQKRRQIGSQKFKSLMQMRYLRSLVDPGEAVGLLASQGVGEPSTQMTLNTFHFAGHGAANVTLGIPRLREIVMTASQKPKTPTMTLPVASTMSAEDIESFCKKASRLTLSQVVDNITVDETLVTEDESGSRRRHFAITINLFPRDEYEAEYETSPQEILIALGTVFGLVLKKEIQLELKKLNADLKSQLVNVGKGKTAPTEDRGAAGGDDDDDGEADRDNDDATSKLPPRDDVSEVGDGDAEEEKRMRQTRQASYESGSEDDSSDDDTDSDDEANDIAATAGGAEDGEGTASKSDIPKKWSDRVRKAGHDLADRCPFVLPGSFEFEHKSRSLCKFNLDFSAETPKLLLVGIIERTCRKTVVHQIANIARCLHVKDEKPTGPQTMMTEGSNFAGIWDFALANAGDENVELNAIKSNDVYAMLKTYGVEAARLTIVQEIQGIFAVYGIAVDGRHVELIADYMTFDGGYKPFNRKGISTHSSPLLKASFETTASFLSDATLYGDFDDLSSPSGSIVVGRPARMGTGSFDVLANLDVIASNA